MNESTPRGSSMRSLAIPSLRVLSRTIADAWRNAVQELIMGFVGVGGLPIRISIEPIPLAPSSQYHKPKIPKPANDPVTGRPFGTAPIRRNAQAS